jgi:hypothetical protein
VDLANAGNDTNGDGQTFLNVTVADGNAIYEIWRNGNTSADWSGVTAPAATWTEALRANDTNRTTVLFSQGDDTYIHEANPTTNYGSAAEINVDGDDSGGEVQGLIRFADIFGSGTGQIPNGASITSAVLIIETYNEGEGASVHRMLQDWNADTVTWSGSFGTDGIQADGTEAESTAVATLNWAGVGKTQIDVTGTLQAWLAANPSDGDAANFGWALLPRAATTNGWDFRSTQYSSGALSVALQVTYVPEPAVAPLLSVLALALLRRRSKKSRRVS